MADSRKNWIWPAVFFIYFLIFVEYPFGMAFSQIVFHRPLAGAIQPTYLLVWGAVRLFLILPLIFTVIANLDLKDSKIINTLGSYQRGAKVAFWSTLAFVLTGAIFYQYFLHPTDLTFAGAILNAPIFLAYALSNAFVEETFFRGLLLTKITGKIPFWLANLVQAIFFAAIHFVNPMSKNLWLFVGLTFVLGLLWGSLTRKYQSLLPAIATHVVADIFIAVSLF